MSDAGGIEVTWTQGRTVAAALLGLLCLAALSCVAFYSSAVMFLVLNKVHPRQAQLMSIVGYWTAYEHDPRQRKRLLGSIVISGVGWTLVLPAVVVMAARRRRPLHGAARFANRVEIERAGLFLDPKSTSPAILIGRWRNRYIALPGQLSAMLSAPTRSGKGVGVVIPNLLHWPDSVVVLDIKGENHALTAGYRQKRGQAVHAFSPFDEDGRSHRWNPLSAVRPEAMHRVGDLLSIGQILFPADGTTSAEAFFNDQARNVLLGIGLYLLETPDLPRTVGELLRQSSGKGQPFKDHFRAILEEREHGPVPLSRDCVDALQRLLSNSDNTLTSIVATFNAPLTIFADTVVDAAMSGDDFSLADLRRKRMSIYVRIPPNRLLSARPLLNLFFSQLVQQNTQALPDEELKLQCLVIQDEFAAMGRVPVIAGAAAFLAGYNLRLLTVVQAMSQLDAVYGDKDARTFATNHGLQILFAPREQRDADEYSAMLGHFTERAVSRSHSRSFGPHGQRSISRNESDQRRALLLPQEFKELGIARLVAVVENCKPVLARKIRYHDDAAFTSRLCPPPEVPQLDLSLHAAKTEQRVRELPPELPEHEMLVLDHMTRPIEFPSLKPDASPEDIQRAVDRALDQMMERPPSTPAGGSIEPDGDPPSPADEFDLLALEPA